MRPLHYHAGQIAIQDEANTRRLAENLAHWVGPVAEFAAGADLLLFASPGLDNHPHFTLLSGGPPLASAVSESRLALHFPQGGPTVPDGPVGGLAISMERARRVRVNGTISRDGSHFYLDLEESFTLCRKYIAPSVAVEQAPICAPAACEPTTADDQSFVRLVREAETVFLASAAPDGGLDVAHRGGPAGFVAYAPETRRISWPEFLGDGVFKSAGNIRATGRCTLLVPDFATGCGYEVTCSGAQYVNRRASRHERLEPLVQDGQPFPLQGEISATVERVTCLRSLLQPRQRVASRGAVTSLSSVATQAPDSVPE